MGKVLVTGATGFTGSYLCRRLLRKGESVVAFVQESSWSGHLEDAGVECRTVDVRDSDAVERGFEDIQKVYHLAAVYRTEPVDRSDFHRVNVEGTRNVLEAARKANVTRVVHCSTAGVQGEITEPPATEAYRYHPGDEYQRTKMEGELLALDYSRGRLPLCVVRPVGIYGPGDTRFLKLFRSIYHGRFVMIGSGQTLYHMTYIEDLVNGIELAGAREEALGEIFTLAGGRYTTLRELVDLIADVLKKPRPRLRIPYAPVHLASWICQKSCRLLRLPPPLYPRRVEFFSKDRAFDISKARRMLGYEPKVDLKEGLRRTSVWYRDKELL